VDHNPCPQSRLTRQLGIARGRRVQVASGKWCGSLPARGAGRYHPPMSHAPSQQSKVLAAALGLALLLMSCSADTDEGRTYLPGYGPQQGPSIETGPRSDTVRVILDEYTIGIPATLPTGPNVFRLESVGFEEHNLIFLLTETDSVLWETERRLAPYETRTVTVDLIPGPYTVVCDFSGHEGRGMFADLLVEAGPRSD